MTPQIDQETLPTLQQRGLQIVLFNNSLNVFELMPRADFVITEMNGTSLWFPPLCLGMHECHQLPRLLLCGKCPKTLIIMLNHPWDWSWGDPTVPDWRCKTRSLQWAVCLESHEEEVYTLSYSWCWWNNFCVKCRWYNVPLLEWWIITQGFYSFHLNNSLNQDSWQWLWSICA